MPDEIRLTEAEFMQRLSERRLRISVVFRMGLITERDAGLLAAVDAIKRLPDGSLFMTDDVLDDLVAGIGRVMTTTYIGDVVRIVFEDHSDPTE